MSIYKVVFVKFVTYKTNIAEVVESFHIIQTAQLVEGSIARVADCCPQPVDPLLCIMKLGGICSAADYPTPINQCVPNQCIPYAHVCTFIY